MRIKILGCSGSWPRISLDNRSEARNTSCLQLTTNDGKHIFFDAGTGLNLANLQEITNKECSICFSHAHFDHICGLHSFGPLYNPEWKLTLISSDKIACKTPKNILEYLFNGANFPVLVTQLSANIEILTYPGEFTIGDIRIKVCPTNHPGGNTAYKIYYDNKVILISGDHEWADEPISHNLVPFLHDVEYAFVDAHFLDQNFSQFKDWGHSRMIDWVENFKDTSLKRLYFSHFNPASTQLEIENEFNQLNNQKNTFSLHLVHDGLEVIL